MTDEPVDNGAPTPDRVWIVTAEVKGKNPGTKTVKKPGAVGRAKAKVTGGKTTEVGANEGGVILYLADSKGRKEEVGRVAFIRANSDDPKTEFQPALDHMTDIANHAMGVLNQQEQIIAELLAQTKPGVLS